MERIKKPPIDIKDIEPEDEEKPQRGPLGYVSPTGSSKNKLNLTNILVSVILSVLLALTLVTIMPPNKKDIVTLLDNQRTLQESTSALSQRLDNVINAQGEYAKKSDIQALERLPGQLSSDISGINSKLDSLDSRISSLSSRIDALETRPMPTPTPSTTTNPPSPIEEVSSSLMPTVVVLSGNQTNTSLFLDIDNKSPTKIEITAVDLLIYPYTAMGTGLGTASIDSVGVSSSYYLSWNTLKLGDNIFLLQGRTFPYVGGPVINPGKDTVYISLRIIGTITETQYLTIKVNKLEYKGV